jgi:hypothetical protein
VDNQRNSQLNAFLQREGAFFRAALERHQNGTEVSAGRYKQMRRLELGRKVNSCIRIYLDTNFWIRLRDHELGKQCSSSTSTIHDALVHAVARRRVVIPATDTLLDEVLFQADPSSRAATAALIDRLTNGIAIVGLDHRHYYELHHWMDGSAAAHPRRIAWTWAMYVMGELGFTSVGIGQELNEIVAKAWDDLAEKMRFSDLVATLGPEPRDPRRTQALAHRLNAGKDRHHVPGKTFEQLVEDECLGWVDAFWSVVEEGGMDRTREFCGLDRTASSSLVLAAVKARILAELRGGTLGDFLPGMQINSSGLAAIRVDPARRYKKGDPWDLLHAATALPYCDALFTDKSMRHLLTTKPVVLSRHFGCQVLAHDEEILAFLETLAGAGEQSAY